MATTVHSEVKARSTDVVKKALELTNDPASLSSSALDDLVIQLQNLTVSLVDYVKDSALFITGNEVTTESELNDRYDT